MEIVPFFIIVLKIKIINFVFVNKLCTPGCNETNDIQAYVLYSEMYTFVIFRRKLVQIDNLVDM